MVPTALRRRGRESTEDDDHRGSSKELRKKKETRDALIAVLSKKESKNPHRESSRGASKRENKKSKHGSRYAEHAASSDQDRISAASPRDRWRTSTVSLLPSFPPSALVSLSLRARGRSRRHSRERKTESRSRREGRKSRGRREEEEEEADERGGREGAGGVSSRPGQGASGQLSETQFSGMCFLWMMIECIEGHVYACGVDGTVECAKHL
jgi:hypothetical protein